MFAVLRVFLVLCLLSVSGFAAAAEPTGTSRFASLDGARVHYVDYGAGEAAVVLIHGWSCDGSVWREQIPFLTARGRVLVLDLPGHGESDKPQLAYTLDHFARGVTAVLDDAGVSQAVLIGHSLGFPIARQTIRLDPGRVKALVNVDGAFYRAPEDPEARRGEEAWFQDLIAGLRGDRFREKMTEFVESLFVESNPTALREEVTTLMTSAAPHVSVSAIDHFRRPESWEDWVFDGPTLALYAEHPGLPADTEAFLGRWFSRLDYEMWRDVSHFLMMEAPDRFNARLGGFLDSVKSAP